ncbi:hypothetical protein ACN28S_38280 [Cystobacter fuscus]
MEGEECHGPDLCAKGLLCRQQADAGTGPSQVCVAAGPRECSYDVDCPFWDQRCRNGFCAPGTLLGEACDNASACVQGLVCANGADGGICAPRPRLGERCYYAGPDGGPLWWNSCMESSCDLTTGVCQ